MSAYSIALSPLLPQWALIALAAGALLVVALTLFARRRGALLRALAFALLGLALLDPSLIREDRRPLKDVVAVVIDQSGSQTIGNRAAQTAHVRAELEKRLGALDNVVHQSATRRHIRIRKSIAIALDQFFATTHLVFPHETRRDSRKSLRDTRDSRDETRETAKNKREGSPGSRRAA